MENILECKGLSKIYKNAIALSSVNLQVAKGRIVGLLGPNGSGKTTLIKIANGLLTPTRGEMLIDGKPIGVETKKLVSYLPDRNFLAQWMTVDGMINYFADFYSDFRRERADAMLESLGIDRKRKIKTLSKGTQEKVALILVMSREAELYMLDERTAKAIITDVLCSMKDWERMAKDVGLMRGEVTHFVDRFEEGLKFQ